MRAEFGTKRIVMVFSCLVEPLVAPLVGRRASAPGRGSALTKSRLAATALATSALLALASSANAAEREEQAVRASKPEATLVRNAHKPPAPMPSRVVLEASLGRVERFQLEAPGEAPEFEWDAIFAHRLKHSRDLVRDTGPGLGLGRRVDRLTSALGTFLRFASGRHLSGPSPALA